MSAADLRAALEAVLSELQQVRDNNFVMSARAGLESVIRSLAVPDQPVAWRTFDVEGGYDFRAYEGNETYRDDWLKRNPKHKGWVIALYDHGAAQPVMAPEKRRPWDRS